ncbi:hypothetical protein SAMN05421890_3396 [Ensifer adhaerens]|nr:hypothetical protein SAMN05421890_3396 [Ensifer adhaerens]
MRAASFTVAAMRVRNTGLTLPTDCRRLEVESLVQFHSVILVQKERGRHHPSCNTAAAFTAAEARFSTPSFT